MRCARNSSSLMGSAPARAHSHTSRVGMPASDGSLEGIGVRAPPTSCLLPPSFRQLPETLLVEDPDAMSFFEQPLDLHQLQAAVLARGLLRIWTTAHDDRRLGRRAAVDDGAGAASGEDCLTAACGQNPREREVHAA